MLSTTPTAAGPHGTGLAAGPLALAALVLALSGCAPGPDVSRAAIQVTDPAGRTVSLEEPARRVVALIPAMTEWIVAMGGQDRLVARTDYDQQPGLAELPSVGGGLTPSVEWLAARRPDLVVAWPDAPSRSLVSRLERLDVAVYTAPVESAEDALRVATDLGTLLGLGPAAAAAAAEVRAGFDSVRSAVAPRESPSVLYLIGLDPLTAAGAGTFVDDLLGIAGGRNILGDVAVLWPQVSLEEVVKRSPDVILVASFSVGDPLRALAGRPGWREVPAVRMGAVHALDPDRVNRPGPAMHQSAALLARLIHGADGDGGSP